MGTTLRQYINAGIRVRRGAATPTVRWSKAAQHLCRLYLKCKSKSEKRERWSVPNNPRYQQWFETLHERIQAYEALTGVAINRVRYFRAHQAFFGRSLFPNQLLAQFSWALYKTHEQLENLRESDAEDEEVSQAKLLRFLSLTRHEPELHVLRALKDSGFFSPEFVGSRGLTCQQLSTTRSIADGSGNFSPS